MNTESFPFTFPQINNSRQYGADISNLKIYNSPISDLNSVCNSQPQ